METEEKMEMASKVLTVSPAALLPGERVVEISSIAPDSSYQCSVCNDSGWRRVEENGRPAMRQCECVKEKRKAELRSLIPKRFNESSFASYIPHSRQQRQALALMQGEAGGSWYLTGAYGSGKTHLLYAQYREIILAYKTRCHVRTTRELVEELRRAELEEGFVSPVMADASWSDSYHLFWDDIDKLKPTDFKTEVLFDLIDTLYRQKHGLTVTSNYSMLDLVARERLHPAIVRRLDDMCRVIEL
jgi:DNA replication protein DnaC